MPEFEQGELNFEPPSSVTAKQGEIFPGQCQNPFWPGLKYVRAGRVGLYHTRLAMEKARAAQVETKPETVETFVSQSLFSGASPPVYSSDSDVLGGD